MAEEIDLRLGLQDDLSRPLEDVGDTAERTTAQLRQLDEIKTRKAELQIRKLANAELQAEVRARRLKRQLDKLNNTSVRKMDKGLRGVNKQLGGMNREGKRSIFTFGNLLKVVLAVGKAMVIASLVKLAAGAVGVLGAGAVIATAGLAPLVGVLGVLPGLLVAISATKGVISLAFNGVSEAVAVLANAASTSAEIDAALNGLTPSARSFVQTIAGLKPQLDDLRAVAQQGLLPGVERAVVALTPLFPILREGVDGLARVLGGLAERGADLLASGPFKKDFRTLAGNTNQLVRTLGSSLLNFVDVFRNITIAAGPLLQHLADLVFIFSAYIKGVTQAGRDSGKLEAFFNRVGVLVDSVIRVVRDLGVGFYNIFRAAVPAAGELGGSIEQVAKRFREVTGSVEGQSKLRDFFTGALPALREFGALVRDVFVALVGTADSASLAPLIRQIRTELLPAFIGVVDALAGGGNGLISLLTAAVTLVGDFFASTAFGRITEAAEGFLSVMGLIIEKFDSLPGPIQEIVGGLALAAGGAAAIKIAADATGIPSVISSLKGAYVQTMGVVSGFNDTAGAATEATETARAFGAAAKTGLTKAKAFLVSAGWGTLGNRIRGTTVATKIHTAATTVLTKAMAGLRWIMRMVGVAARFMFGPWGVAIMLIIGAMVLLYKKNEAFRNLVNRVAAAVVSFGKSAWGWIKRVGAAVGEWLVDKWRDIWPVVKSVWSGVVAIVSTYLKILIGFWKTVIGAMISVFNTIKPHVMTVANFIWSALKVAFRIISVIVAVVIGSIVLLVTKVLWPAIKWVWQAISSSGQDMWRQIKGIWNALVSAAKWVWNLVSTGAAAAWGYVSRSGNDMWTQIKAVWAGIVAGAQWVWGMLVAAFTAVRDALTPIFQAVWGVIQSVWNNVVAGARVVIDFLTPAFERGGSFISGVFGAVRRGAEVAWSGIQTAFRAVGGFFTRVFKPVGDFLGGIWDGIVEGAKGAMGLIRGAINTVIDLINAAIRAYNALPLVPDVAEVSYTGDSQATARPTPLPEYMTSNLIMSGRGRAGGLYAGGPVTPGAIHEVGERGPELFVPTTGRVAQVIGANGPEDRVFARPGYVVPNDVLTGASNATDAQLPTGVLAALTRLGYAGADPVAQAGQRSAQPAARTPRTPVTSVPAPRRPDGAVLDRVAAEPRAFTSEVRQAERRAPQAESRAGVRATATLERERAASPAGPLLAGPLIGQVTINDATDLHEIERAAVAAYRRLERERKERGGR